MDAPDAETQCDHVTLRAMLQQVLVKADLCDPVVAIHVVTAIELLDQRFDPMA